MDKEKAPKEKKYIKRNLNIKNVKLDSSKDNLIFPKFKSLSTKNASINEKKLIKSESEKYSVNVNNYRFLFDINNKESKENTQWVINLRVFEDFKKRKKRLLGEPSFYQNDIDKFKNKRKFKLIKSKSTSNINGLINFTQYKHFFKRHNDNHGTVLTGPLLQYHLKLRNENNIQTPKKWISNTSIDDKKYYYSCSNFYKDKIHGKMTDKNIMRPYKIEFNKSEYNGRKLWIKTVKRDEKKAYNIMGDHLSLKPYNDKYTEKNVFRLKELMKSLEQTQARTWYHVKLRNYQDGKNEDKFFNNKKKWKNY